MLIALIPQAAPSEVHGVDIEGGSSSSGEGGGAAFRGGGTAVGGLRVLQLGAADFVLLVLLALVICYVLPTKLFKLLRHRGGSAGLTACGEGSAAAAAGLGSRNVSSAAAIANKTE